MSYTMSYLSYKEVTKCKIISKEFHKICQITKSSKITTKDINQIIYRNYNIFTNQTLQKNLFKIISNVKQFHFNDYIEYYKINTKCSNVTHLLKLMPIKSNAFHFIKQIKVTCTKDMNIIIKWINDQILTGLNSLQFNCLSHSENFIDVPILNKIPIGLQKLECENLDVKCLPFMSHLKSLNTASVVNENIKSDNDKKLLFEQCHSYFKNSTIESLNYRSFDFILMCILINNCKSLKYLHFTFSSNKKIYSDVVNWYRDKISKDKFVYQMSDIYVFLFQELVNKQIV